MIFYKIRNNFQITNLNIDDRGFSLAELMIGIAIIGIVFAVAVGVFYSVNAGILVTRTRTVATNLASEKIEYLKNIPYKRLAVTHIDDLPPGPNYDTRYYPPETGILVANITYERRVLIKKVMESDGSLVELPPTADDTGLKKITVTVLWREGNQQKTISMSSLKEDPNRTKLSAQIKGRVVSSTATSVGIPNATVLVVENPNWRTTTDSSGLWSMRVASGSLSVEASRTGYWTRTSTPQTVTEGSTVVYPDIQLVPKQYGNVSGFVFKRDHLVISEICPGYGGDATLEYVELYNPTTYPIQIAISNLPIYNLKYVTENNFVEDFPTLTFTVPNPVVLPNRYFLIGSVPTIDGIAADAYYIAGAQDRIKERRRGGVALQHYGVHVDSVAWGSNVSFPSNAAETLGVIVAGGEEFAGSGQGIGNNNVIERRSASGSTMPDGNGNAFDSHNNRTDFAFHSSRNPQNSSNSETPTTGTPVAGAIVFATDDLSLPVITSATGYYTFNMTIATGTWQVAATSFTFYGETSTFTLTTGANLIRNIILSTSTDRGYITGGVSVNGTPHSGITVRASDRSVLTGSGGGFILPVIAGEHLVEANPDNINPSLTKTTTGPFTVTVGNITDVGWIDIYRGGGISGRITINGIDGLSDFPIVAYDKNNIEVTSVLTNQQGYFAFSNLRSDLNNYRIVPAIETGETSTPLFRTVAVQNGVVISSDIAGNYNSFVVSPLYGKFRGYVKDAGQFIETGVLIIATTSTIPADPIDATPQARAALSPNYYSTVSQPDGSYSLEVRGGTYNLYGWYSKISGTTITTTKKSRTNFSVIAGSITVVNFDWP